MIVRILYGADLLENPQIPVAEWHADGGEDLSGAEVGLAVSRDEAGNRKPSAGLRCSELQPRFQGIEGGQGTRVGGRLADVAAQGNHVPQGMTRRRAQGVVEDPGDHMPSGAEYPG